MLSHRDNLTQISQGSGLLGPYLKRPVIVSLQIVTCSIFLHLVHITYPFRFVAHDFCPQIRSLYVQNITDLSVGVPCTMRF
jgi:hypothetical protein